MTLTPAELKALTSKSRPTAQARALRAMGIAHIVRADGTVAVSRQHVEGLLGGGEARTGREPKNNEPDWSKV